MRPVGVGVSHSHRIFLSTQVMVPGVQNSLLLKALLPDTEYKVTVTPVYTVGEGVSVSAPGKTCK
jgi:hypothetical protein